MRIREIRVNRYGPLSDVPLPDLGDFTLVFGGNESGKTLLLDAILRFLLKGKRERDLFSRLDRVEHEPNGFIELQKGEDTYRFPDDGSLPDLLDVHAEDLRNILVVRAGDLQVQPGQQKDYYADLTDRLTGIHREPMKKIVGKLREIGRLTPGGALSDSQENDKIASRFKKANDLISTIDQLKDELAETDLVEMEARLLDGVENRETLADELELLRQAEKRQRYEKGKELLAEVEQCLDEIEELPAIGQEHYDTWRDAESEIEDASGVIENAERILAEQGTDLKRAEDEVKEARRRLNYLEAKESAVRELGDEARRYRKNLEADVGRSLLLEMAPRVTVFLGVLFAVAVVTASLVPEMFLFRFVSWVLGILLALAGSLLLFRQVVQGRRLRQWETLRLDAAELGIRVEEFEALLEAIKGFSADLKNSREGLAEANRECDRINERVQSQREHINRNEEKIKKANETLAQLRGSLQVASLEELKSIQEQLGRGEAWKNDLITELRTRFGEAGDVLDEMLEIWRDEVEELADFKDAAKGVEFDESKVSDLEVELNDLDDSIKETEEELNGVRSQIADIASEANRILRTDDPLPGDTFEDLVVIDKALNEFMQEVGDRSKIAEKVIEILEEIQAEEEQKVKELFSEDDLASKYFRAITNSDYERVDYDPDDGELKVMRADGEMLGAYVLSSGTYDQLYLATRLSLAERLLQGDPGFLLLDDPFLTSDRNRLDRQLEILQQLVREGWQIVYFSVKDEVRDRLQESIDPGDLFVLEDFTLDRSI